MGIKKQCAELMNRILKPKHSLRLEMIGCLIFYILLSFSVFSGPVAFICFIVCAVLLLFLQNDAMFRWLLFAFPFAVVFKMTPDSSSFFTYLEFLALFLCIVRMRKFSPLIMLILALLALEVVARINSFGAIVDIVKLTAGLMLLYFFTEEYQRKDAVKYVSFFLAGMIASSLLGMFKLYIPRFLSMYYGEIDYVTIGSREVMRFEGIFNDPNYFAIAAMLCVLVCLLETVSGTYKGSKKSRNRWLCAVLGFVLFSVSGLATVSKSFFLLYAVTIVTVVLCLHKVSPLLKKFNLLKIGIAGILLLIVVVLVDPFDLVSSVLYRLTASNILTGRGAIWVDYWNSITQTVGAFLFGSGIDAGYINNRAAHNMYLESVYYIGLMGLLLYIGANALIVWCKRRPFQRSLVNYLGFLILAMAFFFLCGLNRTEIKYYLMIGFIVYNRDFLKNRTRLEEIKKCERKGHLE